MVLLLTAPLQSWGVRSDSPSKRDTAMHPSRSGLVGLLAACRGLDRTVSPSWADDLDITVRIDKPGEIVSDYHTVGGGYTGDRQPRTASGSRTKHALLTDRDYIADAAFVVTVSGPDDLVDDLATAVQRPRYTPFLGRKSCPPATPLLLGTSNETPLTVLARIPAYGGSAADTWPGQHREASFAALMNATQETGEEFLVIVENPDFAVTTINDRPVSFNHWSRTYGARRVGEETVRAPRTGKTGAPAVAEMRAALQETTP